VIPASVGDLAANGLLTDPGDICWERAAATLKGREDLLEGVALASAESIAAFALFLRPAAGPGAAVAALRAPDAAAFARLVAVLAERAGWPLTLPKVHPGEIPAGWLAAAGFRAAGAHHRYAARALPG
jgi:hypothetical protein